MALVCLAMRRFPRFRRIVRTRRATATSGAGSRQRFDWGNTNKLLRAGERGSACGRVGGDGIVEEGRHTLAMSPLRRAAAGAAEADHFASPLRRAAAEAAAEAAAASTGSTTAATAASKASASLCQPAGPSPPLLLHCTGVKTGWIPNAHGQRIHACLATAFSVLPDEESAREAEARDEALYGCLDLDEDDHNTLEYKHHERGLDSTTVIVVVLGSESKQQRFDDSERIARFLARAEVGAEQSKGQTGER